jgi:Large polyvalent protein-associated domain 7
LQSTHHREAAMDADKSPARQASSAQGGTVEPAHRAPVAIEQFQTPKDSAGERYEMRDPFAEATYRAKTLPEMAAKADQLGSTRFVEVAVDGKRTLIQKVDGQWQRDGQREQQRPASPERPLDPVPAPDDVPPVKNVVPMQGAARTVAQPGQVDAKVIAKIDAQAEHAALVSRLEAALMDRYLIKRAPVTMGDVSIGRTEYRFRGDTSRVAFTESTLRLATDTNSPSVARSMVDVAQARNWKALRTSGHEEFRRLVWFEASLRGVKAIGYEPMPSDLAWLRSERETRAVNRIEPARDASGNAAAATTEKGSARGGGGRKAVLSAIEAVLVAKKVPEKQRVAVMAAATEKLAQRIRDGHVPKVKVYDKSAPSQRPVVVPTPEMQRTRDRAALSPTR